MSKTVVMLPDELNKIDAVLCSRTELEHITGMVDAACWLLDDPINGLLNDILSRLNLLLGKE